VPREGEHVTAWQALHAELDAWHALGRPATLWWRDDDACEDTPALRRLLGLAREARVPVAIAAVPAGARPSLADAVGACAQATVLQHGYAHRNRAPAGARSAERSEARPVAPCLDELLLGRARLQQLLGERFVPVMVPPWNRADAPVLRALADAGFDALSRFGPRDGAQAVPGLAQVNTHVDLVAWRRGRTFIGADAALERTAAHLRARRTGMADAGEPTGLLTHHLAFDAAAFDFVAQLLAATGAHPAVAWCDVRAAFGGA
jgi:hypothetical protein